VHTGRVMNDSDAAEVRVLVVDDQRPFRHAIRSVLRHLEGFTFAGEAETGERSVDMVADLHPDLVLMDINLPGMSGIDATRRILDATPDTVVFLCSTYGRGDLPPAVATSGAAAYIHKEELTADLLRALWATHRPPAD
jgi:DNA-binding NarL/FixJ family response regulator